jgi:hypothetical protein
MKNYSYVLLLYCYKNRRCFFFINKKKIGSKKNYLVGGRTFSQRFLEPHRRCYAMLCSLVYNVKSISSYRIFLYVLLCILGRQLGVGTEWEFITKWCRSVWYPCSPGLFLLLTTPFLNFLPLYYRGTFLAFRGFLC